MGVPSEGFPFPWMLLVKSVPCLFSGERRDQQHRARRDLPHERGVPLGDPEHHRRPALLQVPLQRDPHPLRPLRREGIRAPHRGRTLPGRGTTPHSRITNRDWNLSFLITKSKILGLLIFRTQSITFQPSLLIDNRPLYYSRFFKKVSGVVNNIDPILKSQNL